MKKVIMSMAILLASFTTSLFALEWGGLINNQTMVSTPDFKQVGVNQTNEVYLWMNSPLNTSGTLRFAAEGMYRFNYNSPERELKSKGFTHALDVNVLKFSGNWLLDNNSLLLDIGRYNYADKANAYFMQKSDGINLRYNTRAFKLGFYAGYTGLQNKVLTVMQNDAVKAQLEEPGRKKDIYELAYGYVPVMADLTISKVGPLSLGFQTSYFIDIKDSKKNIGYGSLLINSRLGNIGSLMANVVVGTENFKNLMMFGALDLTFFVNSNVLFTVGGEYASGNSGKISTFRPITARPVGTGNTENAHVIAPHLSGLFMLGDALITLNEKLTISSNSEGTKVNSLDSTLGIVYNIFSDLQVGATGLASVSLDKVYPNNFAIMLNASLSL